MKFKICFSLFTLTTLLSCSNSGSNDKADNSLKPIPASMTQKTFADPDNTAVYTTKFVITDHNDITEVYHNKEDGAWQFFSDDQFDDFEKVAKIAGLGQITKIDATLFEIADLPMGYFAHRKFKGDKWIIEKKQ